MEIHNVSLEKCPFCNSDKLKVEQKSGPIHHYLKKGMQRWQNIKFSVRCNDCHARGGTVSADFPLDYSITAKEIEQLKLETELKAIEKWNIRY